MENLKIYQRIGSAVFILTFAWAPSAQSRPTPAFQNCNWAERVEADSASEPFSNTDRALAIQLPSSDKLICGGNARCDASVIGTSGAEETFSVFVENIVCEGSSNVCPGATACANQGGELSAVPARSASGGARPNSRNPGSAHE